MTMKANCSGEKLFELADRFTNPKSLADTIVFNNRVAAEKPLSLAAVAAKVSTEGKPRTRVDVRRAELRLRSEFMSMARKNGYTVEFTDDDDGRQADKTIAAEKVGSSTDVEKPAPAPKAPAPVQVAEVAHAIATLPTAAPPAAKVDGRTRFIEHDGQKLTSKQWAEKAGVSLATFQKRRCEGWSMEKILSTPLRGQAPRHAPTNPDGHKSMRATLPEKPAARTIDDLRAKLARLDEVSAEIAKLQEERAGIAAELGVTV